MIDANDPIILKLLKPQEKERMLSLLGAWAVEFEKGNDLLYDDAWLNMNGVTTLEITAMTRFTSSVIRRAVQAVRSSNVH